MLIDLNIISYNFTTYHTPLLKQVDTDTIVVAFESNSGFVQILFNDNGKVSSYVVIESLGYIYGATFDLIKATVVSLNNLPISGDRLFNVNLSRVESDRIYIQGDVYGCSVIYPPQVTANVPDANYGGVTVSGGGTVWSLNSGIDPAKITQDSTHRFVSDTEKNTWDNKQSALGYTPAPESRTLTINGVTYDLSADRSWTVSTGLTQSQILARTFAKC